MKNPNGYGSVIKLDGNRRKPYAVRVTIGYKSSGSARYKYLGYFSNIKDAKHFLANYNRDPYKLETPTLAEIWELFGNDVLSKANKNTVLQRQVAFNHFSELHDRVFDKIKPIELQNCISKYDSPSVQATMRSTFAAIEKYALKCELSNREIAKLIDTKPIISKHYRNAFSEEEINQLWEQTFDPIVKDALILIYTGWRIQEYVNLQKTDIKNGFMYGGLKTQSGRDRCVPIHPRIMPLVQEKLDIGYSSSFSGYNNTNAFRYHWKSNEILNKHVIHETRHTFRTRLDNVDANKVCIDLIMGHKSKDVGERYYTHKTLDQLVKAVNLLT